MGENLVSYIMLAVFLVPMLLAGIRFLCHRLAPVRTVHARVVGKNTTELPSKYGKSTRYVVIFQAEDKKLSLFVSELSYGGYHRGETGTLKYQGDRIIDFN
jgi:hypothetical protein